MRRETPKRAGMKCSRSYAPTENEPTSDQIDGAKTPDSGYLSRAKRIVERTWNLSSLAGFQSSVHQSPSTPSPSASPPSSSSRRRLPFSLPPVPVGFPRVYLRPPSSSPHSQHHPWAPPPPAPSTPPLPPLREGSSRNIHSLTATGATTPAFSRGNGVSTPDW